MPLPIEIDDRHQTAVLWVSTGTGSDGRPTVGDPAEVLVRWSWLKDEVTQPTGDVTGLEARVTMDRAVPINSLLWLGTLEEWSAVGPQPGNELQEVTSVQKVWDLKGRSERTIAGTARYSDAVPP